MLFARLALGVLVCLAVALAAVAVSVAEHQPSAVSQQPTVPPALAHGTAAPSFSLARLGGGAPVSYAAPGAEPVVLQFFASWCPGCLAELRAFASASRLLSGKVRFVGIDSNDSRPAEAEKLLREAGDTYATGLDPFALVAQRYLVAELPTTVFIDPAGHVVDVAFGAQTAAELEHWASVAEAG